MYAMHAMYLFNWTAEWPFIPVVRCFQRTKSNQKCQNPNCELSDYYFRRGIILVVWRRGVGRGGGEQRALAASPHRLRRQDKIETTGWPIVCPRSPAA